MRHIRKINPIFLWVVGGLALLAVLAFYIPGTSISVFNDGESNADEPLNVSPVTGEACSELLGRPIAVMMAGDAEARPLSGISKADLVIEMAVDPRPITRFMSVFQCDPPSEIGSVRSAREDFIPLALGLDVLYAHWGGERNALNQLNSGVADNIDALKYDGTYFTRKSGLKPPHNGFTTVDLINKISDKLGYALTGGFKYPHSDKEISRSLSNIAETISIDYLFPVKWVYDSTSETYKRYRNGTPEIDRIDSTQVSVANVVVMETEASWIGSDQYISVRTQGEGRATFYQKGVSISGTWKKNPSKIDSLLEFLGPNGKPYEFTPGRVWVQIKSPLQ